MVKKKYGIVRIPPVMYADELSGHWVLEDNDITSPPADLPGPMLFDTEEEAENYLATTTAGLFMVVKVYKVA